MTSDPVPDVMRLDALFVRDSKLGGAFGPWLLEGEAVHAISCHDCVSNQGKVDIGKFRENFGVGRLRDNVGNLAISPKDTVEGLLRKLRRRLAIRSGNIFHPDTAAREAIQVFQPRTTAYKARLDSEEGVEPRPDGFVLEQLGKFSCEL